MFRFTVFNVFLSFLFITTPLFQAEALSGLEQKIFELVNKERSNKGLPALAWDERLADASRYHSKRMATLNFFDHVAPDGEELPQRLRKFEIQLRAAGENISKTKGHSDPSEL